MRRAVAAMTAITGMINSLACAESAIPELVETKPPPWAIGVPVTTEIVSFTFNQAMHPGFWSWMGRSSLLPTMRTKLPAVPVPETFELGVRLRPGRVYVFALNEGGNAGVGFQTKHGRSLPPRFLVFRTAGPCAQENAPPVLVRAVPADGAVAVDPGRRVQITLTFDRPMMSAEHGLEVWENGELVNLSDCRFRWNASATVFTLMIPLKPRMAYELRLNSMTNIGFRDRKRIPLWPRRLSFFTGDSIGSP